MYTQSSLDTPIAVCISSKSTR